MADSVPVVDNRGLPGVSDAGVSDDHETIASEGTGKQGYVHAPAVVGRDVHGRLWFSRDDFQTESPSGNDGSPSPA